MATIICSMVTFVLGALFTWFFVSMSMSDIIDAMKNLATADDIKQLIRESKEFDDRLLCMRSDLVLWADRKQEDDLVIDDLVAKAKAFEQRAKAIEDKIKQNTELFREELLVAMERGDEKTLKLAVTSVWKDLEGTLKTLREDFDASIKRTREDSKSRDDEILNKVDYRFSKVEGELEGLGTSQVTIGEEIERIKASPEPPQGGTPFADFSALKTAMLDVAKHPALKGVFDELVRKLGK